MIGNTQKNRKRKKVLILALTVICIMTFATRTFGLSSNLIHEGWKTYSSGSFYLVLYDGDGNYKSYKVNATWNGTKPADPSSTGSKKINLSIGSQSGSGKVTASLASTTSTSNSSGRYSVTFNISGASKMKYSSTDRSIETLTSSQQTTVDVTDPNPYFSTGTKSTSTVVVEFNGAAIGLCDFNGKKKEVGPWPTPTRNIYYENINTNLIFNASSNGGTTSESSRTVTYGQSTNSSVGTASKSGYYYFDGWWTAASGGTKVYDSSGKAVSGYWSGSGTSATWNRTDSTVYLYAHFYYDPPQVDFTVYLYPNGGTYSGTTSKAVTIGYNYGANAGIPTKTNSVFEGWYTSATGGTQVYDYNGLAVSGTYWSGSGSSATWRYSGNLSVYAHWGSNVTVRLNPNGGYYNGTSSTTPVTLTYNSTSNNNLSTKPTRSGYVFTGWYTSQTGGTQVYDMGGRYVTGSYFDSSGRWLYTASKELMLYARWESVADATKTLTLDPNEGKINKSTEPQTKTVIHGDTMNNSVSVAKKALNNFMGWYTAKTGGVQVYDATGTCTTNGGYWSAAGSTGYWQGSSDLTLYAQWSPRSAENYTITYNANGGTDAPAAQTKVEDVTLTLSADKPVYSRHTFIEWNTESDGSGTDYQPGGYYTEDESVTLYAIWQESPKYTVSYNANGGSGAPGNQTKYEDEDLVLSEIIPTTSGGLVFSCWNTRSDGTGTDYQPGQTYTINAALQLFAQYAEPVPVGESLGYRVMFAIGKSTDTAPSGGSTAKDITQEYGHLKNLHDEGYRYALFSGPDGTLNAEQGLRAGFKYHTRSLAYKSGGNYGYHFVDLLGAAGNTE